MIFQTHFHSTAARSRMSSKAHEPTHTVKFPDLHKRLDSHPTPSDVQHGGDHIVLKKFAVTFKTSFITILSGSCFTAIDSATLRRFATASPTQALAALRQQVSKTFHACPQDIPSTSSTSAGKTAHSRSPYRTNRLCAGEPATAKDPRILELLLHERRRRGVRKREE